MLISFSYLRLAILLTKLPHLSGKVTGAAIFLFLDIQALHPAFLANTVSALYISTIHLDYFSALFSILSILHITEELAHLIVVCPSLFHLSTPHPVKQKPDKGLSDDSPLYSFYFCLFTTIFIRQADPHTF